MTNFDPAMILENVALFRADSYQLCLANGGKRDFAEEQFIESLEAGASALKNACHARHGEWIHDINNLYGCSECLMRQTQRMRGRLMNYCPNCGAKMDGGKEHDTP